MAGFSEDVALCPPHIIKKFAKFLNIETSNLFFYGSSAGGFASLLVSAYFKNSTAIVNNPQTDVVNYEEVHVKRILKIGFSDIDINSYRREYRYRSSPLEVYEKLKQVPNIYFLQNSADTSHLYKHALEFVESVSRLKANINSKTSFSFDLYHDEIRGHSPMDRKNTVKIVNEILSGKRHV